MKASEKALYINQLASVAGISLDKIAPFVNNFKPLKEKKEINIQFFKVLESVKLADKPIEQVEIPKITTKVKVKVSEKQLRNKLATRTKKLADLISKIESFQKEINEIYDLLKDPNQTVDLTEKLKIIVDDGFWGSPKIENGILTLETTNDVICTDLDKVTKLSKNLGKYQATLDLKNRQLRLKNLKQHKVRYFNHPYATETGSICWGTASGMAYNLMNEYKIDKLFKLLSSLLTTHAGGGFSRLSEY